MQVQRSRWIQVSLPSGWSESGDVRNLRDFPEKRVKKLPTALRIAPCPSCGGAMARGEGVLGCAVCAYTSGVSHKVSLSVR